MSTVYQKQDKRPRDVSVIIKTYDNSALPKKHKSELYLKDILGLTLTALETQTHPPLEVLVVDSSAGSGIAAVVKQAQTHTPLNLRHIPMEKEAFSHPKALNLGIRQAGGNIITCLSGDATPAHEQWLENLIAPLKTPQVAGSFSRHIARPGQALSIAERMRLWWRYRSKQTTLRESDHLFSNASSAFRKTQALETPFDESLYELEDYEWAKTMQAQGNSIAYVGNSAIYHTHSTSSLETLQRMLYYVFLRLKSDNTH